MSSFEPQVRPLRLRRRTEAQNQPLFEPPEHPIWVTGPGGTGKTFTISVFSRSFVPEPVVVRESVRSKVVGRSYDRDDLDDPTLAMRMQAHILSLQIEAESAKGTCAYPNAGSGAHVAPALYDRCCLDALVYARHFGPRGAWRSLLSQQGCQAALHAYRTLGLVVLVMPNKELHKALPDDCVRKQHCWNDIKQLAIHWEEVLQELGVPFIKLDGELVSVERRASWVLEKYRERRTRARTNKTPQARESSTASDD